MSAVADTIFGSKYMKKLCTFALAIGSHTSGTHGLLRAKDRFANLEHQGSSEV
jgi:hypothetical protein